ncbi:Smr/MutS family protein [Novosphingobium mangrovi (ex Huang et al. 2023)]|uniref:Smr/MutS family protein n=1 Tax=Novosphingobium mangrovi (ex Huang et al. 2023) TaxID=2976432 RepID=A0ABT2I2N7_9SPHN|nr:Smr/MutS family protein [Novosphingobium mangrovi (ex Huang et al. 2023)]MCT2399071.1 Smr/MutS family protein [Novosphingobium mangrovi (ex Huang et al. 2023)]
MRRPGRRLSAEEAQVWAQVARTVTPLDRSPGREGAQAKRVESAVPVPLAPSKPLPSGKKVKGRVPPPLPPKAVPAKPKADAPLHLDGSWEKRISKGGLVPDFSLDLHGASLEVAHSRLMHGLMQARAMGARVVLVVTGKPRPVDAMDRGERRGAIRAKISDWLAASEHASDIVAIRGAHRRHGGHGALYLVLRRRR